MFNATRGYKMSISRLINGAVQVSAVIRGYLVTRTYFGYSKRDAGRMFRSEMRHIHITQA